VNGDKIFSVLSSIVTVGLVTVLVTKPNTATVIKALGNAFSGSLRTAMGNG
jgi:hypothetical protein